MEATLYPIDEKYLTLLIVALAAPHERQFQGTALDTTKRRSGTLKGLSRYFLGSGKKLKGSFTSFSSRRFNT